MRILVVEDEIRIQDFIRKGLEMENFAVDTAIDGEEAVTKAEKNTYDLIIMDVMLPKMTGVEATKKIRILKAETPIIMLTAKDTDEDQVKGFEAGADYYVIKPFVFGELLARVNALLRRKELIKKSAFYD